MDNLTHLSCRSSMLFYDARTSDFMFKLRDKIDKLESLRKLGCTKDLKSFAARGLWWSRWKKKRSVFLSASEGRRSSSRTGSRSFWGRTERACRWAKEARSTIFLTWRKTASSGWEARKLKRVCWLRNIVECWEKCILGKKLWYSQDQDDLGYQESVKMSFMFCMDQFVKETHKEQPWYEVKEDKSGSLS